MERQIGLRRVATAVALLGLILLGSLVGGHVATSQADSDAPAYVTLPTDFPGYEVPVRVDSSMPGYVFLGSYRYNDYSTSDAYLLIVDDDGEPVYYKHMAPIVTILDFKRQPNGWLTFFVPRENAFFAMDSSYSLVAKYEAGNGRLADLHDFQLLPNGHALLLAYDQRRVDMSAIVPGGHPAAVVTGLVIQELDPNGNVVFEWESWDHIDITDTNQDLTAEMVDYVHGNSVEVDYDGNLLISSRHLDEVTKISRSTGEVLWRLGGKQNDFTFTNDEGFCYQHDARRTSPNNIMIYDNGVCHRPRYSRAVEYLIDEENMTATRVWEYRNTPDTYAVAMGNSQRLPNGNTMIGWGSSSAPVLTEVTPYGSKVFELHQEASVGSYRAFRFEWQGFPQTPPTLVARPDGGGARLYYSWNGATEVARWQVWGGTDPDALALLEMRNRDGFETTSVLSRVPPGPYFVRVVPLDARGQALTPSNLALLGGYKAFIPGVLETTTVDEFARFPNP